MPELIDFGSFHIRFLQDKHDTAGSADMFELVLQSEGRMPVPHYHEKWEETVYGLSGVISYVVDGQHHDIRPGDSLFIPRGKVHSFSNRSGAPASCLCILTPGILGPEYFRELAALLSVGKLDPARAKEIMLKHGLVPA